MIETLNPEQVTIIGLLIALGVAGLKKLWVFGWIYSDQVKRCEEITKDRDWWRDIALKAMGNTESALEVTKVETKG